MSEVGGEFLREHPEYIEWHKRNGFLELDGDRVQLLDPVTGKPREQHDFSEGLLQDEWCAEGVVALKDFSERDISIKLIFNPHRGMEDFNSLIAGAGQVIDRASAVGIEWDSAESPTTDGALFAEVPRGVEGQAAYTRATLDYIRVGRTDDRAVPVDIDYIGSSGSELCDRLNELYRRIQKLQKEERKTEEELARLPYQAGRTEAMLANWARLASFYDLNEGDSVALIVGSGHELPMTEKLRNNNITFTSHTIGAARDENDIFSQSTMRGYFSLREFEASIR